MTKTQRKWVGNLLCTLAPLVVLVAAVALLTGSGLILAVPMAVAIDCGLVACEIALVTEPRN